MSSPDVRNIGWECLLCGAERHGVWSYRDTSNLSVRQHIVYEEEAVVDGVVVTYFRLKLVNQRTLSGPESEGRWREREVYRLEVDLRWPEADYGCFHLLI